jgi:hypothetical protein
MERDLLRGARRVARVRWTPMLSVSPTWKPHVVFWVKGLKAFRVAALPAFS